MMLKTRGRVEALCRLRTLPDFPRALVHPAPEVIVDTFSERQTALESFSLLRDFGRSVDFLAPDFHDREVQAYFAPLAGGFVALAKRNTMYRVMHMVPPKNADVGASEWMGNQIADLSARVLQVGTLEKNLGSCLAASHDAPKIVDQSGGASITTSTATDHGDEQQQADVEHTNQESAADPTTIVTIDPSFGLPGQGRVDNTRIIAQTGGGRSSVEEENKGIAAALEEIASLVHAIMELQPTTTGSKSSTSISSVSAATTTSSTSSSTDVVPRLFSELAIRLAKFETVLAFSEDLSFADFYLYKVAALFDRIASKILYVMQEALKNYEKLYCTEKRRFVDDTVKEKFANDITAGLLARLGGALLEDEIEAGLGLEQVEDINLEEGQRLKPLIAAAVGELRERISVAFRSDLLEKDFSVREDGHEVLPQHFSTDIRFCPHSDKLLRGLLRSAAEMWASALTDVTDMAASMSAETGKVIAAFSTLFSVSSSSPGGAGSKDKKLADFLFRRGALAPFFDGTAAGGARAGGGSSTEEPEQDPVATIQEDFVAFWVFARDSLGVGAGGDSPIAKLDPAKVLTGEQRLVLSSDDIIAAAPAAAVLKKSTEEQLYDEPAFTTSSSSWTPHQQALDAVRVLGGYSTEALQAAGAPGGRLLREALESYTPPAFRVAAAFVRLTKLDFVLRNAKRQQRHIEFLKRMTNRVSDSLLRGSCLAGLFSRLLQIDGEHPEFVQRKQKLAAAAARRGGVITPLQEATELVRTRLDIFEWQALHFFFHMVKQSNVRHLREGKSPVAFAQNGQNPNDYSDQWLSVEYHEDHDYVAGGAPDPGSRNNGIEGYFRSKYLLQTITGEHERISMTEKGFVTEYHHALMHQAGHKFNPFLCYQLGQPLPPLGAAAGSGAAAVDDEAASITIESRGPAPSSLASSSVTRFWTATPNLRDPVSGRKYSPSGSSKFRKFPKWHTQRQSLILNSTAIRLMDPFVMAPPREEIIPADSSFLESVTPLSNLEVRLQCTYPLLRVPACLLEKQRLSAGRASSASEMNEDEQTAKSLKESSYVMKPLQTISIGVFLAAVETRVLQDEELRDSVYFHLIDPWPEGQRNIPGLQDFRTSTTQSSGYDDVCRGDTACAAKVVQELQKHVPQSRSANAAFTSTSATRPPTPGVTDSARPEADEQEHKSYEWGACGDGIKDHDGARTSGRSAGSGSAIFDFCSYADARVQVSSPSSPSKSAGSTTSATDHSSDDWCLAHAGSVHTLSLGSLSTAHDDCVALVRGSLAGQRKMIESRAEKNTFQVFQEFAQDIHTFFAGNSSDFIFVDGDHSEAGVRADLEYYFWKVKKPGGILAGHDLGLFTFPGMAHGVLGFFHELLHGYCAGLGIRTAGAKADGARDELFSTLEPYCETGLTINVSSDYVYWIEF
eukprot:g11106.t1